MQTTEKENERHAELHLANCIDDTDLTQTPNSPARSLSSGEEGCNNNNLDAESVQR